jgi:hypothetical protein
MKGAWSVLGLPASLDQPRPFEHLQMLADRWQRHVERLGELGHRLRAGRQIGENGAAGRVGERGERVAQGIGVS